MWLSSSTVGRKVVMSVSGLFLILFLTFHMSMNLVAIFSEEGILRSHYLCVLADYAEQARSRRAAL